MATKKTPQSKAKSRRGGRRPGAGRKVAARTKLRAEWVAEADRLIVEKLPYLVGQLFLLAEGIEVQVAEKNGGTRTYSEPPDREAIKYLMDRALGRPKQAVDVAAAGEPLKILVEYADRPPDAPEAPPGAGAHPA